MAVENNQLHQKSWGAFEFCLFFAGAWLFGLIYHRAVGENWTGLYPYAGATMLVFFSAIPIALAAPTTSGKVARVAVPGIFIYLFYSAAPTGDGIIEKLQLRLELPHFLLVFASTFVSALFTAQGKREAAQTQQKVQAAQVDVNKSVTPISRPVEKGIEDPFERIVGQDQVIAPLREIAGIVRSGIRVGKRNAPHAVLLFLGPTGVGKTEAARALAEAVYGAKDTLIRFDMGQFTDAHQANRFYGPPPGYVGASEGGQLTRAVTKKPKSVVLLDEMEKAHPQIWDAFLPVFDEGYIVDGSTNQKVDMTNTVIVLTSNLLTELVDAHLLEPDEIKDAVAATGTLRPELLGRINEILVFKPLGADTIREILGRRLDSALWGLSEQGIVLKPKAEEIDKLLEQVKAAKFGVRQIDDVVRKYLRQKIAEQSQSAPAKS